MKECEWCFEEFLPKCFSKSKIDRDFSEVVCNQCYDSHWNEDGVDTVTITQYRYANTNLKEYIRRWLKDNPHVKAADNARRYKRVRDQVKLSKHFQDEIDKIYKSAFLIRSSGEDVHVDHIVPLAGENVTGLHVPWNLQIISAEDNLKKSNKFTDGVIQF